MTECIEISAAIGTTIALCPHCGKPIPVHVDAGELITDVTNAATTATNLVNASNIVRDLITSGQVPPEVLEDVLEVEARLTRTTAHLTGGSA